MEPRASILEAPGLDFGGLGAPNATQELPKSQPSQPGTTLPAKQLKTIQKSNQKSAEICRELAETRQLSAKLFLDGGTGKPRLAKKEGAAVTPPWGFSMEFSQVDAGSMSPVPFFALFFLSWNLMLTHFSLF